jgi:hypothetical protein
MIERISDLPPGIDGFKAVGKLSREDYETTLMPLISAARQSRRQIRLLYQLGPEFEGLTPGGAWEDAKFGLQSLSLLEGCAVVTDHDWIRQSTRVAGYFLPCPVRAFPNAELADAVSWLGGLPQRAAVSQHMLTESGVLVLEVDQPLRAEDFKEIERTADGWIETHGKLPGLVLHMRHFPGWENLDSMLQHARFVRDHRRLIKRVALVADGAVARIAPTIVDWLVVPEVKRFRFDELDAAIHWAGAHGVPKSEAPATSQGAGSANSSRYVD